MSGGDYRKASHRIWEEMAAGWDGDGYRMPGMCLNVLAA